MISTLELRRIFSEWRTRIQRVKEILHPPGWSEGEWKQFGRGLVELLQRHGTTWTADTSTYWDLRWRLNDGGELICQAEAVSGQKLSLVVAQMGGFVEGAESYTWFWMEFNPEGNLIRDPYVVEGTWKEALFTLLVPFQYQAGYYLAGSTATPSSLWLDHAPSQETSAPPEPSPGVINV